MPNSTQNNNLFMIFLLGGAFLLTLTVAVLFHLYTGMTTILVLVLGIVLASMALWYRANQNADGDEWWQDDDATGWRGR